MAGPMFVLAVLAAVTSSLLAIRAATFCLVCGLYESQGRRNGRIV
ncbi:hypothetical protein LCGC14_3141670, partial [marine sediment metagenome]